MSQSKESLEGDLNRIIHHKKVVTIDASGNKVVTINYRYVQSLEVPILNLQKIHNERRPSNPYYVERESEEKKSSWCVIL